MKKKMDPKTKVKLMFMAEYMIIGLVFGVIAILILCNVIKIGWKYKVLFKYLTLAGGVWVIANFFWTLLSKKRRTKTSLLDKALALPASLYLIPMDIYAIIMDPDTSFYKLLVCVPFIYLALVYLFEGPYHFKYPTPEVLAALEDEEEEKTEQKEEDKKEGAE